MATSPRPARDSIITPSRCRWCFEANGHNLQFVMPGLVPGIHAFEGEPDQRRGWPGQSPAMTMGLDGSASLTGHARKARDEAPTGVREDHPRILRRESPLADQTTTKPADL